MEHFIQFPTRFGEKLKAKPEMEAAVLEYLSNFKQWFTDNKTPFFPEYTDHGIEHMSSVFATADSLITDESWEILTPEDIATLAIAILHHDSAMHLYEGGFCALVFDKYPAPASSLSSQFDTRRWSEVWKDYLSKSARFDAKKLNQLFGDTSPAPRPVLNAGKMTDRDRLLIGDFLRQHHPRLAHEFALAGVIGDEGRSLSSSKLTQSFRDLAGLVARSHGMPLRTAIDAIRTTERRKTLGVHAPYIMAILRIADYFQIQPERAPQKILGIKGLISPISRREWEKHSAIEDINNTQDDPEMVYIRANPNNVSTYLELKYLFSEIQREIDECWAALGEVYGRFDDQKNLGLPIRRIKSNLDNTAEFSKTITYIPTKTTLDTAGAELIKLLAAPLYGDNPSIGVRELMQNALDACRERHSLFSAPTTAPCPFAVRIEITESNGDRTITISDDGIGMTAETIQQYFLTAGASFRKSDAWKNQNDGKPLNQKTIRSGRFGIGAIAAFLLGDNISVTTRHATTQNENEAIVFSLGMNDDIIELRHTSAPIGTTISIQLSKERLQSLLPSRKLEDLKEWEDKDLDPLDWYCLESPPVNRTVNGLRINPSHIVPGPNSELPLHWNRINTKLYQDVCWTHLEAPNLICNGIRVGRNHALPTSKWLNSWNDDDFELVSSINFPNLSIFDPDAFLPLNLERSGLTSDSNYFQSELQESVATDFICFLLGNFPKTSILTPSSNSGFPLSKYPGFGDTYEFDKKRHARDLLMPPLGFSQNGVFVNETWTITQENKILAFNYTPKDLFGLDEAFVNWSHAILPFRLGESLSVIQTWVRFILNPTTSSNDYHDYSRFGSLAKATFVGQQLIITKQTFDYIQNTPSLKTLQKAVNGTTILNIGNDWIQLSIGAVPEDTANEIKALALHPPTSQWNTLALLYTSSESIILETPLQKVWNDLFGSTTTLPYNEEQRVKQFPKVYEKFKDKIAHYRTLD